jgi:inhibitor of growth protein 3
MSEGEGSVAEGGDTEMAEVEEVEEGDGDDIKYCTCRNVSYGNMVACDNDKCPYEWFHWSCVNMTREPAGKWYCPECRIKLGIKEK